MKRAQVIITDEGIPWIKQGQMWMYRNNLSSMDECQDGDIVDLVSLRGEYIGTGFVSLKSHIVVRLLTKDQSQVIDDAFFKTRINDAYDYRESVEKDNLTNCRFIFGEADGLPGLIVDRYNDVLVTQISNVGMESRKKMIYQQLLDVFAAHHQVINAIYERNDIAIREKEGLTQYKGFYYGHIDTTTMINENGLKLAVDFENGQKTGYFLDQKSNRVLVRELANNKRVLDCFTHTGGFALNAAFGGAAHVDGVDVSQTALTQAKTNAELNHLKQITWIKEDVFDYLDHIQKGQYDIIILDPPAFTKSRRTVNRAYQGYKRINLQAMNKLNHGGYLITCSCSRYMETALFEQMLKEAAHEANVTLKQVSVTQQNKDHPILWTMTETSYLKFYIFQIVR